MKLGKELGRGRVGGRARQYVRYEGRKESAGWRQAQDEEGVEENQQKGIILKDSH